MRALHSRPRFDYDQCGGFGHGWQACEGRDAIGPIRMFQWDAINDLPPAAFFGDPLDADGRITLVEPFRVALRPRAYVDAMGGTA